MIKTVGDFLQALKKIEEQRIASFIPIPHAPTIGAMYEGATRQLLDKALFCGVYKTSHRHYTIFTCCASMHATCIMEEK